MKHFWGIMFCLGFIPLGCGIVTIFGLAIDGGGRNSFWGWYSIIGLPLGMIGLIWMGYFGITWAVNRPRKAATMIHLKCRNCTCVFKDFFGQQCPECGSGNVDRRHTPKAIIVAIILFGAAVVLIATSGIDWVGMLPCILVLSPVWIAALFLLPFAIKANNKDKRQLKNLCRECGYDLTTNTYRRCPECGENV